MVKAKETFMAYTTPTPAITETKGEEDRYPKTVTDFVTTVRSRFAELQTEISQRNQDISSRDNYIYGNGLNGALDVPIGHDFTPVNWLRRTVEIHKNMFMSRGFEVVSTYDSKDTESAQTPEDQGRLTIENTKQKEYAEARQTLIRSVIDDNGGYSFWSTLAENASAVGNSAIKAYWNEKEQKYELCQIESIENLYALWSRDDFRKVDAYAYVYQVSKQVAISDYGANDDVATSPLGNPLEFSSMIPGTTIPISGQKMVSILEVTGKIEGWAAEKGKVKKVRLGQETELNVLIIGNELKRVITDEQKMPKYYILPNKHQRRRPWGIPDVSEAAININLTYVETLSDWRTVASKVNFPKYKAYGFAPGTQLPKSESRKIQVVPLSDGQDIQELTQGNTNGLDWGRQLDELKEQFVRETGLSRVLFDDPSVTLNSNQALLTSMKPTSDIAEAKKQLWAPVIVQIFKDALDTIIANKSELKGIADNEDNWTLKVMWPSIMQKEDPVYQSMLLNRFNAGLMSVQSFMEAQGETKEEIDRIKSEATDPITSAILGKTLPLVAQTIVNAATAELQAWYQSTLPQQPQQQPQQPGAAANGVPGPGTPNLPGVSSNGGTPVITPDNSVTGGVGISPVSQPGTGATAASPAGSLATVNQNQGG